MNPVLPFFETGNSFGGSSRFSAGAVGGLPLVRPSWLAGWLKERPAQAAAARLAYATRVVISSRVVSPGIIITNDIVSRRGRAREPSTIPRSCAAGAILLGRAYLARQLPSSWGDRMAAPVRQKLPFEIQLLWIDRAVVRIGIRIISRSIRVQEPQDFR